VVERKPQDAASDAEGALPDDPASLKRIIRALTRSLDEQRARADRLEQRLVLLSEVQSRSAAINRNRDLGPTRTTATAVVNLLASKAAAGAVGPDGMVEARLAGERGLAEAAGVSTDTASRHLDQLAEMGTIRRETRWIPDRMDPATGVVHPGHKLTYIGLQEGATVVDLAAALAQAKPEKPRNWGGKRTACPDHPDAGTVKRWSLHCAECDRLLDRGEDAIAPADTPETRTVIGKPQDAASGAAPDPEPKESVATVLLCRNRAALHNNDPAGWDDRTAQARADLLGRRAGRASPDPEPDPGPPQPVTLPGLESPPLDRWTG
jgi:hypothetical protein